MVTIRKGSEDSGVQPLLLTIPQVMKCLSLGRNKVYDLINKEGLPVKRFGKAVRVPYVALQQWLEQRDDAA
jgi:excisionase family DNA binding protein